MTGDCSRYGGYLHRTIHCRDFEDTGTEMSTFVKENGKWQAISSAFGQPREPEKELKMSKGFELPIQFEWKAR